MNPMVDGRQPIILLAEDSEADVLLLERAFAHLGIDVLVHSVPDGAEAIAYLNGDGRYARREEFPLPDLLLLDLKMPLANGFEVIQWVRAQPRLAALRIVVLTTSDQERDIDRAHRVGANSFLVKPISFDDFKVLVRKLCEYWLQVSETPHTSRPARRNIQ
jgi:CheY-like chemotaxis protein